LKNQHMQSVFFYLIIKIVITHWAENIFLSLPYYIKFMRNIYQANALDERISCIKKIASEKYVELFWDY
ncbi:MAG: hypothetical protein JXA79_13455, partial [Deltaproteobacteria bacterium]|nr:hypothetical protein [Deltaproteobacteria bacterium]